MKKVIWLASGLLLGAPAFAATIYNNPYSASADTGNCEFSSICGNNYADDIAAQLFTINTNVTITAGDFTELDSLENGPPSSANWAIYTDSLGLPGSMLFSGTGAPISLVSNAGLDTSGIFYVATYTFNIPTVALTSGSYFFALQTTSSYYGNNLAEGTTDSGAAETKNGTTWAPNYEGIGGVAVELDGAFGVPEPATLGFVAVGFCMLGLMRRRKTR